MNKKNLLEKLEKLNGLKELEEGFPSQQACVNWANEVAPLLKFNQQYYVNFIQNAHNINLPLSSFTLGPSFIVMRSQVQMAIHELRLAIEEGDVVESGLVNEESGKSEKFVFVACGQSNEQEKNLGIKVKTLLKDHGVASFFAETANDLESLNSHIFKNLNSCLGFIAILHKRRKIEGEDSHATSVWINQEVAIAAYLRSNGKTVPSFVLYEEGAAIEGLIKYTIANPPTFTSDEDVLSKIKSWVKTQRFEKSEAPPGFDIVIDERRKRLGSSSGGGRADYYEINYALFFKIRNKSDVNICLEEVVVENEILGRGALNKANRELSKLPFNIGPRKTEAIQLLISFPNGVNLQNSADDFKLCIQFVFSDHQIMQETVGYLHEAEAVKHG